MNNAHPTPGPWTFFEFDPKDGYSHGIRCKRYMIAAVIHHNGPHLKTDEEADAHLIAAAPTLLNALQGLITAHKSLHPDPVLGAAEAAIAKARGAS